MDARAALREGHRQLVGRSGRPSPRGAVHTHTSAWLNGLGLTCAGHGAGCARDHGGVAPRPSAGPTTQRAADQRARRSDSDRPPRRRRRVVSPRRPSDARGRRRMGRAAPLAAATTDVRGGRDPDDQRSARCDGRRRTARAGRPRVSIRPVTLSFQDLLTPRGAWSPGTGSDPRPDTATDGHARRRASGEPETRPMRGVADARDRLGRCGVPAGAGSERQGAAS